MKAFLLKLGAIVAALAALWWMAPQHMGPPNILLITIDTLRADYLTCLGGPASLTPNLDGLAKRGILFERAYAQCDRTAQSHMSILAGCYLSQFLRPTEKSRGVTLLPEIVRYLGYHTAAIPSSSLLNPEVTMQAFPRRLNFGRGFDEYFEVRPAHTPNGGFVQRLGADTNAIALPWLRQQRARRFQKPWFLWLHYYDCHGVPLPDAFHPQERGQKAFYAAGVHYTDHLIGQVLKTVNLHDTAVVVAADHGESVGEHEFGGHAGLYDAILRVPLLVVAPSIRGGVRISDIVENCQVLPICARLAGGARGQENVLGPKYGVARAYAETRNLEARMEASDQFKFIEYRSDLVEPTPDEPTSWSKRVYQGRQNERIYREAGLVELFDLQHDPHETKNLVNERGEVATSYLRDIESRYRSFGRIGGGTPTRSVGY